MTWDQFAKMFCSKYVQLVKSERLVHEYLDLRQETTSVMEITKMFTERDIFCPEFADSKKAQMTRYFSMLKMDIRRFVATHNYGSLLELQEASRQRDIEMELQMRERRPDPTQSQPMPKQFKAANTRYGSQRGYTCGKYGKVHEGAGRSGGVCHNCYKEGHYVRDCHHPTPVLSSKICFHCDHFCHVKVNCPLFAAKPL